jgi:hypothetical protein
MHLFMAREAVDKHLAVAGDLIKPHQSLSQKVRPALRALAFYARWYPSLWLRWSGWPRFRAFGRLGPHLRFVDRMSRRLARTVFHKMMVHGAALERRQAILFRVVDIAMDLFAMTATVVEAQRVRDGSAKEADGAGPGDPERLADLFCRTCRRGVEERFRALKRNDDALKFATGRAVLAGDVEWLERGIVGLGRDASALTPVTPGRAQGR